MTDDAGNCCSVVLDFFTDGYREVKDLESKENMGYDDVKNNIENIETWTDLEKETREKIEETVKFFSPFRENEPNDSQLQLIEERLPQLNEDFLDLYNRHLDLKTKIEDNSAIVERRYNYCKTRKGRIVIHAGKALLAAILLGLILGGVLGWNAMDRTLPTILGALLGAGSVLVIGGLCYLILVGVAGWGVKRWENLRGEVSKMKEKYDLVLINKKRQKLDLIAKILKNMMKNLSNPSNVKRGASGIIENCNSYDKN